MKRFKLIREGQTIGLHYVVILQRKGYYTGYIGVPKDSKLFNVDYNNIGEDIDIHGGITFSDKSYWDDSEDWYFGFDCNHYMDRPNTELAKEHFELTDYELDMDRIVSVDSVFRDLDYVVNQCKNLAIQLKGLL